MRRQQTGFSLVELLVVLVVAGIVLAFGVPSFNAQIKNSRLTGAVNQLVTAMHLSRSEASKRKVPVVMCASSTALDVDAEEFSTTANWNEGWLVFADINNNGLFDRGIDVIVQRQDTQSGELTILGDDLITQTITYLPNGFAQLPLNTASGRFIVYCNPDLDDRFSRVLSFSNSGRPQIVSRDDVTSGAPSCG